MQEKRELIQVGFWYSSGEPLLPKPIIITDTHDKLLLDKLQKLQKHIEDDYLTLDPGYHCVNYRGVSYCRICDQSNGNKEITFNGYTFPEGYIHYIIDHNIHIDPGFKQMILNLDL